MKHTRTQGILLAIIWTVVVLLAGVYLGVVSALTQAGILSRSDQFSIGLAFANFIVVLMLAGVTLWYAKSTKEIADATRTQAEATRAQVDLQRGQLSQGVRPIIRFPFDSLPQLDHSNVVIRNMGIGPALNVKCWVQMEQPDGSRASFNNDGRQRRFCTAVLEVGGIIGDGSTVNWQLSILPTPTQNLPCIFFAVYQDVYGNHFVSKAAYELFDFQNTRLLRVAEFAVGELNAREARDLLVSGGYA